MPEERIAQKAHPAPVEPTGPLLLVDDSTTNRMLATAILNRMGYEVDAVPGGRAAIEAVRDGDYAAVLMDLQMPEMDGVEATAAIRDLPNSKGNIPVIAMTAHVSAEERQRCVAAGMDEHLGKPIDRAMLATILGRLVGPPSGQAVPAETGKESAGRCGHPICGRPGKRRCSRAAAQRRRSRVGQRADRRPLWPRRTKGLFVSRPRSQAGNSGRYPRRRSFHEEQFRHLWRLGRCRRFPQRWKKLRERRGDLTAAAAATSIYCRTSYRRPGANSARVAIGGNRERFFHCCTDPARGTAARPAPISRRLPRSPRTASCDRWWRGKHPVSLPPWGYSRRRHRWPVRSRRAQLSTRA